MGTGMPGDGGGLAWHAARDCVLSGDEQGTDRRSLVTVQRLKKIVVKNDEI